MRVMPGQGCTSEFCAQCDDLLIDEVRAIKTLAESLVPPAEAEFKLRVKAEATTDQSTLASLGAHGKANKNPEWWRKSIQNESRRADSFQT